MSQTITSIRGMNDILPTDIGVWHALEEAVRHVMQAYDYTEMRTPLVERSALFHRSIGEVTDIVEKEMYTFADRKGDSLSLRPEATASCVRAAIQHSMAQNQTTNRLWYIGPMFRYERPQKGRQRQFHQVGAEVYGVSGPAIEVELILLSARLWKLIGISDVVQLEINTLGDMDDRAAYREALVNYFNEHRSLLDEDSLRRLETNPLRILDSKNPAMAEMLSGAPALDHYLSAASAEHFQTLQALLDNAGVSYVKNPRLVRGLDYYSHTVFEWTTDKLGAQSAVCAGGRYDTLFEQLGSKPVAGVGWAMGLERLVALMTDLQPGQYQNSPDVFLIVSDDADDHGGDAVSLSVGEWLRNEIPSLRVARRAVPGSIKSQFKRADKSGADFAIVIGQDEVQNGTLTLKSLGKQLLANDQEQVTLSRDDMLQTLRASLVQAAPA